MLGSRFSMWMAWGPELTFFCNDAYRRDTLGKKYPWALGKPRREVWAEIWHDIGPRIETVIATGVATWDEALMLFLERSGYTEETYHTFSYSPLTDDDGAVAGMLCVVSEDTERVIGERRHGDPARPRRRAEPRPGTEDERARRRRAAARGPRRRPAVLAGLPVRRGRRRRRGWPARPAFAGRHPAAPATVLDAGRRAALAGRRARREACRVGDLGPVRRPARPARGTEPPTAGAGRPARRARRRRGRTASWSSGSTGTGRSTTATAASSTWSPGSSRRHRHAPAPTRPSGAGPRRSPSSTGPRRRSSPTSATSSARR